LMLSTAKEIYITNENSTLPFIKKQMNLTLFFLMRLAYYLSNKKKKKTKE